MIDTHCHIYLPDFNDDIDEVLSRAFDSGISDILMPAIDFDSIPQMESMHHKDIRFHMMAGIHPVDVKEELETFRDKLTKWANRNDIIAIGETGLDYHWSTEFVQEQKESLRFHCSLAKDLNKPIVLHNRKSTQELLDMIEEEQDGRLKGVWHCFNGTVDEGKRAIDLGLHLGIGGVVTFKNGGVDKTVKELSLDKMVLETDAPYLTPTPYRGKRNEPSYTGLVADKLAEIFEMSRAEIIDRTSSNARLLFSLDI